jgi:hypothetical protein
VAAERMLLIDFDDGSVAHDALRLFGRADRGTGLDEVFPAPGDSGAPALLGGRVAAIGSFATRLSAGNGAGSDIDSVLNRSFGEISALTRLSQYDAWLAANTIVVPEPAAMLPVGVCLMLVVWLRPCRLRGTIAAQASQFPPDGARCRD